MSVTMRFVFRRIVLAGVLAAATGTSAGERGNPSAGMATYLQECAACHGAEGRGDGPTAPRLHPKPANFWERSDSTEDKQVRVVTNGGEAEELSPNMPSFDEALSPQQIRDVVAYVRERFPAVRPADSTAKK